MASDEAPGAPPFEGPPEPPLFEPPALEAAPLAAYFPPADLTDAPGLALEAAAPAPAIEPLPQLDALEPLEVPAPGAEPVERPVSAPGVVVPAQPPPRPPPPQLQPRPAQPQVAPAQAYPAPSQAQVAPAQPLPAPAQPRSAPVQPYVAPPAPLPGWQPRRVWRPLRPPSSADWQIQRPYFPGAPRAASSGLGLGIVALVILFFTAGAFFFISLPLAIASWSTAARALREASDTGQASVPRGAVRLAQVTVALSLAAGVLWIVVVAASA